MSEGQSVGILQPTSDDQRGIQETADDLSHLLKDYCLGPAGESKQDGDLVEEECHCYNLNLSLAVQDLF